MNLSLEDLAEWDEFDDEDLQINFISDDFVSGVIENVETIVFNIERVKPEKQNKPKPHVNT